MFGLMPNGELRQANLKMLFQKAKQYESSNFKGLYNFINFNPNCKVRTYLYHSYLEETMVSILIFCFLYVIIYIIKIRESLYG